MLTTVKAYAGRFLLVALLSVASPLNAHLQKEAYTTLLFNQRSGNLEVSHRFYSHDAEFIISKQLHKSINFSASEKHRQEFSDYIANTFKLYFADQPAVTLDYVGNELEGQYIWVYQEIPVTHRICVLTVSMTAFHETWPQQANHINVESDGMVQSARLTAADDSKRFELAECVKPD